MSSYQARRERRKWRLKYHALLHQMREQIRMVERAAEERVAKARHALARIHYDQPVRWQSDMPVALERETKHHPVIALRLLASRQMADKRMLRFRDPLAQLSWIEEKVSLEIARAMVAERMVCIDTALVPTEPGSDFLEFDFAVYVGSPSRRGPIRSVREALGVA